MNYASFILRKLESLGISHFFMVPGKLINPFMSCYNINDEKNYNIRPIVAAHEAGACAMADGYARATNNIGISMSIDGPGAANAIPMLLAAQADNSPVLHLAGHIPVDFQAMGAIQDTSPSGIDIAMMLKYSIKKSYSLTHCNHIKPYFNETCRALMADEKGAGFISFAKNILLDESSSEADILPQTHAHILDVRATDNVIKNILERVDKVAIIMGAHAKTEDIYNVIKKISEKNAIPVATTISSKGMFDDSHPNFLGIFGYSGHQRAHQIILNDVETIILIGFDFTQWTSLAWHEDFTTKKIIQVEISPSRCSFYPPFSEIIQADPETWLNYVFKNTNTPPDVINGRQQWHQKIKSIDLVDPICKKGADHQPLHPGLVVKTVRDNTPRDAIAVADAGVHRSFATHYWQTFGYGQFFAATSFAPMGWAVPASIGISIANKDKRTITFTGDGCMLMSGFEIQTAAKYNLPITYIVFNNSYYGASYFNNQNNLKSLTSIPQHNWAQVAEGFGVKGIRVHSYDQLFNELQEIKISNGPVVLDIITDHTISAPCPLYSQTLKTHPFM